MMRKKVIQGLGKEFPLEPASRRTSPSQKPPLGAIGPLLLGKTQLYISRAGMQMDFVGCPEH